jgi:hypothetical protein
VLAAELLGKPWLSFVGWYSSKSLWKWISVGRRNGGRKNNLKIDSQVIEGEKVRSNAISNAFSALWQ